MFRMPRANGICHEAVAEALELLNQRNTFGAICMINR